MDISGGYPGMVGLGHVYAVSGQPERAHEILGTILQREKTKTKTKTRSTTALAIVYAGLKDRDHALEWLEKGYEERYEGLLFIKVHFFYDNLRSDPRFADLLRRVGFIQDQ
jgi:hypothetical protein